MHRRGANPRESVAAFGRTAVGALAGLQRVLLLVGVFLFVLAMASTALDGTPNRTVNLHFSHSDVSH
jgi:hypothetical protein